MIIAQQKAKFTTILQEPSFEITQEQIDLKDLEEEGNYYELNDDESELLI